MAESAESAGKPQVPPEQACFPPAGSHEARCTQDSLGQQDESRTPEEEPTMPSPTAEKGDNSTGTPLRAQVSASRSSEASGTERPTRSATELLGSSSPAITPAMDAEVQPPSAANARGEKPVQAKAHPPGAPNPNQALVSPTTPVSSPAPTGGSVRSTRWLGYWAGGGDITDLSPEHQFATVHAALTYYAGVDLLGIL